VPGQTKHDIHLAQDINGHSAFALSPGLAPETNGDAERQGLRSGSYSSTPYKKVSILLSALLQAQSPQMFRSSNYAQKTTSIPTEADDAAPCAHPVLAILAEDMTMGRSPVVLAIGLKGLRGSACKVSCNACAVMLHAAERCCHP